MLELGLAVCAGILTAGTPCVLPMLPIVFGASIGGASRLRPLCIAGGFAAAFAGAAILFSAFTQVLGVSPTSLRELSSLVLVVFGALMIWPEPFERLATRWSGLVQRADSVAGRAGAGNGGGFVLGLALGIVWTPCAGPVLASILTLIATAEHLGWAALLLCCYAVGAAVPMLAVAYGGQFAATHLRRWARYSQRLQQGFGVVVILVAVAIFWQYDTRITAWLTQSYPAARTGL